MTHHHHSVLIVALFFLALTAGLLHLRAHPYCADPKDVIAGIVPGHSEAKTAAAAKLAENKRMFIWENLIPAIVALFDIVLVTLLFCSKKTAVYGHLLNGMFAILGTIVMSHFTIAWLWPTGGTFLDWVFYKSTLMDILILWADFLVGKALYDHYAHCTPSTASD